ncbi:hypothetical protein TRFO_30129 [Tritrichomonas foetus]|uniref:NAD-dependent epimerase/dehydratase domain-containing protein n=1 Tax=Tritrichomonas foetus TaxID=1144522 RepID=A0A1J4JUL4_9EUKA|nr:hypothetical protein TRFO_30129 [Tritrichomonas foetus]|eukprot:OHT02691.1 hypothetical protein TRFO_30129 [Tritrichomonas foetus]
MFWKVKYLNILFFSLFTAVTITLQKNQIFFPFHDRLIANRYQNTFCRIDKKNTSLNGTYDSTRLNISRKKTVLVTGATGVMGQATLESLLDKVYSGIPIKVRVLARSSSINRKKLEKYQTLYNIKNECRFEIVWGDFLNYNDVLKSINGADYVLHIGGLVSPAADTLPYLTNRVNIESAENIIKAINEQPNKDEIKVCYIGSVAETGSRNYPIHWGRTGDPIKVSIFDHYGVSKVIAERVFAESGLKNWVVLRQSAILHHGLLHHMDPIIFTVPMNGVLEWCTVEDSGRLMANLISKDINGELPKEFWKRFYNIGSGENYRLTNYEFESHIFGSIGFGSKSVNEIFAPHWFASKNFHGHFYSDGDVLENYLHFRENLPTTTYFERMATKCHFFYRIPKYIPHKKIITFFVKPFMWMIASTKTHGSLDWIKTNNEKHITASFGSRADYNLIPHDWESFNLRVYNTSLNDSSNYFINHGFNESKPVDELDINDMKEAAIFRGGEVISQTMKIGDLNTKLKWKCGHCGKTFTASPNLILFGGHWCPHCFIPSKSWDYDSIARSNPFFAQVWYP